MGISGVDRPRCCEEEYAEYARPENHLCWHRELPSHVSIPIRVCNIQSLQSAHVQELTSINSFFYDHPALLPYKWYWRVEPSISFTCAITYDPFVEMALHKKVYGYTIALWEKGTTVPSLFRKLSDYKARLNIPTRPLWTAMIDPSYLPWPFRRGLAWLRNRDQYGDLWNMCHFWSNFEIADMDFFRSPAYRDLFQYLDEDGGFYFERWGDAPVHSLAAALLLKPEELHHFSDFGYIHSNLQYCTHRPTEQAWRRGELVPTEGNRGEELGCRCTCDPRVNILEPTCFNRIKQTVG